LSELATMTEVAQGTSLSRFGHGELLITNGKDAKYQKHDKFLMHELRNLRRKSPCLVCMPPYDPPEWSGFRKRYGEGIEAGRWYGSSFVSRHDWAPWTKEYRELLCGLWKYLCITIVAPEKFILTDKQGQQRQRHIFWVKSPGKNAFDVIDELEREALNANNDLTILSCGPTATVLADRLARKGIWAVDLGNFGKFL